MEGHAGHSLVVPLKSHQKQVWAAKVEKVAAEAGTIAESRFWETGITIPDDLLPGAATGVAEEISAGSTRSGRVACLLLFHLLRTRLTNVRANRLWPEVAGELAGLSGLLVDPWRCAHWFREVLVTHYGDAIEDVLHRFVACALDEAGVGWDGFRIVREFLQQLVSAGFGVADPAGRVTVELDRYRRRSHDRDDIEALVPQL